MRVVLDTSVLDEKLRTSAIARRVNLTDDQARDVRSSMFALLDPLVDVSGERIGCEDPDDDHILELAINAKARFIVARDNDILNLPRAVRKRLDDNGVTVIRADVFCALVRELFPLVDSDDEQKRAQMKPAEPGNLP